MEIFGDLDEEISNRCVSLAEWLTRIPVLTGKGYVQPLHLQPLLDELEKIQRGEQVRLVCHTPPRGGKTETLLSAISWWLSAHPSWEIAYCSYNATQARSKAEKARDWAKAMGVEVTRDTIIEWRTPQGGGCIARGVGEGITGQGVDVALVDDPVKDRAEAESSLKRERAWDWFNEALYTRKNPNLIGGDPAQKKPQSIIVNMARWHPDDLAGRLVAQGWKYIKLPALSEEGGVKRSFWPVAWPVESLEETQKQIGDFSFEALYQGNPRKRGDQVFNDVYTYQVLPYGLRTGGGIDSAYSIKTSADRSAHVTMHAQKDGAGRTRYFITFAKAVREKAPKFKKRLRTEHERWPGMKWLWYAATTELGAGQFIEDGGESGNEGIPLRSEVAKEDKFARAIDFAAAWNRGDVFVPAEPEPDDEGKVEWLSEFLAEMASFTGIRDRHDDLVDAAVAAYDVLQVQTGGGGGYAPAPKGYNTMGGM